MEVRDWYELKTKLCKTADEMTQRKSYDRADIDVIDKLTHSIEKINKIIDHEGGANSYGNSYGNHGGMWTAEGSYNGMMPNNRDDGYSMGRRYSRDDDMRTRMNY